MKRRTFITALTAAPVAVTLLSKLAPAAPLPVPTPTARPTHDVCQWIKTSAGYLPVWS